MGHMAYEPYGMPEFTARIWAWFCRRQVHREAERLLRNAAAKEHERLN